MLARLSLVILLASAAFAAEPQFSPARQPIAQPAQRPARVAFDPFVTTNGDSFLALWSDMRFGNVDAFAARYDSHGEPIDRSGFPLHSTWRNDYGPSAVWDGERFLAFAPAEHMGTFPLQVTPDARVTSAGELFSAQTGFQPSLAWNGHHYGAVFHDGRDGTISFVLLDRSLAIVKRSALPAPSNGIFGSARVASAGGDFLVVWESTHTTADSVFARQFTAAGEPGPQHVLASMNLGDGTFPVYPRLQPALTVSGNGYTVVWTEESAVRGARIPADGATVTPFQVSAEGGRNAAIAWDGTVHLIVWLRTLLPDLDVPTAALTTGTGEILETFPLAEPNEIAGSPSVASNGDVFLLLWGGHRFVVDSSATPRIVKHEAATAEIYLPQTNPAIASGTSNLLTAWHEQGAIYAGRLSRAGAPLDGGGIRIATLAAADGALVKLDVVTNGSTYLVVWEQANAVIRGARFTEDGRLLNFRDFAIADGTNVVAAARGDEFLVAWLELKPIYLPRYDISAAKIPASGPWAIEKESITTLSHFSQKPIALLPTATGYALLWQQNLNDPCRKLLCPPLQHEQRLTRIDAEGKPAGERTILINQEVQDAVIAGGEIVIVARNSAGAFAQRFNESGEALAGPADLALPREAFHPVRLTRHPLGFAVLYSFFTPLPGNRWRADTRAVLLDRAATPIGTSVVLDGPDSPTISNAIYDGDRVWLTYNARWNATAHAEWIPRAFVTRLAGRGRAARH